MSNEIELTAEEKALIISKREKERASGLLRQQAYDKKVIEQTKYVQSKLDKKVDENKKLTQAYKDFHEKLVAVNPNYKLVTKKQKISESVMVTKLEFIDADGREIYKDADGNFINSTIIQEVAKELTDFVTISTITYVGSEVPDGCEYTVSVSECEVKKGYNTKKVFKMTFNGTNVGFTECRTKYSVAKSVHTKISEYVTFKINKINAENETKLLNELALAKAQKDFHNSLVSIQETYKNRHLVYFVKVTLENGLIVTLDFRRNDDDVEFNVREIQNTEAFSANALVGVLAKAQPKNV